MGIYPSGTKFIYGIIQLYGWTIEQLLHFKKQQPNDWQIKRLELLLRLKTEMKPKEAEAPRKDFAIFLQIKRVVSASSKSFTLTTLLQKRQLTEPALNFFSALICYPLGRISCYSIIIYSSP